MLLEKEIPLLKSLFSKTRLTDLTSLSSNGLYPEAQFLKILTNERRRAERSNRPLTVMVVDVTQVPRSEETAAKIGAEIPKCLRDTDVCGYLRDGTVLGAILTEIDPSVVPNAKRIVEMKVRDHLATVLDAETLRLVAVAFMTFSEADSAKGVGDLRFYPEASLGVGIGMELAKRALDVVGSICGLLLFSPLFFVVSIMIKLTSRGPVFFRQQRVGRNGRSFELLKFRSMYLNNDDVIHRKYVENLIRQKASSSNAVYKIQGDPRVTPLGRYLRKYSVDELPQLLNVLKGDMSLVGPRPPILYEVEHYFLWQRNRLLGRKPGITGVWQVTGRSTTTFDDMVRLDLRYIRGWSLLLDLKILLKTPAAVLRCKGAY